MSNEQATAETRAMYPEDDKEFEDMNITKVDPSDGKGWIITFDTGWSFWVQSDSPVAPVVGMTARIYGKGIGSRVRGLYLDGQRVYYRSLIEDDEYSEVELYGADAAEWLRRWDEGRRVWTIEMGGLGPGYEQCIHIVCAETLRYWLSNGVSDDDFTGDKWSALRTRTDESLFANKSIDALGLSGAQYGAGLNIAAHLFRKGPRAIMKDPTVKDRHIQVSKSFPQAA